MMTSVLAGATSPSARSPLAGGALWTEGWRAATNRNERLNAKSTRFYRTGAGTAGGSMPMGSARSPHRQQAQVRRLTYVPVQPGLGWSYRAPRFLHHMVSKMKPASPRMLCIAGDFTRYDEHAVQQINRNIGLIRYRKYGNELLLFELVNAVTAMGGSEAPDEAGIRSGPHKTVGEHLDESPDHLRDVFEALKAYLVGLGDDVQVKPLKFYVAFRRIKNFACVEVRNKAGHVLAYLKVDPDSIELEDGFTRDVRDVGHYGTGDLEVVLKTVTDLERAKPLFLQSYEAS